MYNEEVYNLQIPRDILWAMKKEMQIVMVYIIIHNYKL